MNKRFLKVGVRGEEESSIDKNFFKIKCRYVGNYFFRICYIYFFLIIIIVGVECGVVSCV